MPRLFIAIDIPERIKDDILSLYRAIPGAKWVDENQLHITLKFIGEVDSPTMESIKITLRSIKAPSFDLRASSVGFFPPRKDPKVLWVGVDPKDMLTSLQGKIERALQPLKLQTDNRKFHPHITIARLDEPSTERIITFLTEHSLFLTEPFSISQFHLYQSFLRKEGAHHIKEASYQLDSFVGS